MGEPIRQTLGKDVKTGQVSCSVFPEMMLNRFYQYQNLHMSFIFSAPLETAFYHFF